LSPHRPAERTNAHPRVVGEKKFSWVNESGVRGDQLPTKRDEDLLPFFQAALMLLYFSLRELTQL
jgi:hypothetical protein